MLTCSVYQLVVARYRHENGHSSSPAEAPADCKWAISSSPVPVLHALPACGCPGLQGLPWSPACRCLQCRIHPLATHSRDFQPRLHAARPRLCHCVSSYLSFPEEVGGPGDESHRDVSVIVDSLIP